MAINRYTQAPIPRFNPMSMQELAYTPTLLRQQHDQALSAAQQIASSLGEYDVLSDYGITAQQAIQPLEQELSQLSEDISTQGIQGSKGIQRAMNLARQRQQLFGQQGAIGQLQGRTQQYRDAAKQIQEDHKSNPLVRDHLLSQLQAGQAQFDSETGQVNLGEFSAPRSVRDIPQEEIIDRINLAVSRLKPSELKGLGIEDVTSVGNFNDLITIASEKGLDIGRISNLISGMIGPEEQASIVQQGAAMGLTPEQSLGAFNQQLQGIANASAYSDRERKTFNIEDKLGVHRAKKVIDEVKKPFIPFRNPTGRLSNEVLNPFSNAQIGRDGQLRIKNVPSGVLTDPFGKNQVLYKDPQGNIVTSEEAIKRHRISGPGMLAPESVLKEGYQQISIASPEVRALNDELNRKFQETKEANEELRGLSDPEALEKINNYFENISEQFSKASLGTLEKKTRDNLADIVIATAPNVSVYGPTGKQGTLDLTVQELGFKNFADFKERGKDFYTGVSQFGPEGIAAHTFTVTDGKGNKVNMYVEADENVKQLTQTSSNLNQMVLNGDLVTPDLVPVTPQLKQAATVEDALAIKGFVPGTIRLPNQQRIQSQDLNINPIGTNQLPYRIKLVDLNLSGQGDIFDIIEGLKQDVKGKTSKEVKALLKGKYNLDEEEDYLIEDMQSIYRDEEQNLFESLDYLR